MKRINSEYAAELIKDIDLLYTSRVKTIIDELNIKLSYRPILSQLREEDGLIQQVISYKTGMSATTISITLRSMEDEGLVRRATNEGYSKTVSVYITDAGKRTLEKLESSLSMIDENFFPGMTETEKIEFIQRLENIKYLLEADENDNP